MDNFTIWFESLEKDKQHEFVKDLYREDSPMKKLCTYDFFKTKFEQHCKFKKMLWKTLKVYGLTNKEIFS